MALQIGINGAGGRMGRRLMALTCADPELELAEAVDYAQHPSQGKPVASFESEVRSHISLANEFCGQAKVVIDFSSPAGTANAIAQCAAKRIPLVIGTTGIEKDLSDTIHAAARNLPIVWAANMSLGVNLLLRVSAEIAKALGDGFDIEIVESHHNKKADAPSGTALALAKSIAGALGRDLDKTLVHGRQGRPGPRTKPEIGMHALRLGSVIGDHTVHWGSDYERIELTHRAQNRDVFASGALRAAKWLSSKPAGLYDMQDVLFG